MARASPGGAYGLRVEGVGSPLLVPPEPAWPPLRVERRQGPGGARPAVGARRAVVGLQGGGHVACDRAARTATFVTPRPLDDDELVHPYLAPAGMLFAFWDGREALHCGAFLGPGGGAWGLVGDKESGKSTLLAWLALRGHPVLCDDLLVVEPEGRLALPGPRCLDLRPDAARRLAAGGRVVRAGERHRLELGAVGASAALRGWVVLCWDPSGVGAGRVPPAQRLARLSAHRAVRLPPQDPAVLLDLAALPVLELRRPRSWRSLEASGRALLDLVTA